MLKKLLLTAGIVLSFSTLVFSQTATLQGVITDQQTGEPIPFANIIAERGGTQVGGATSDFDGKYSIRPIEPGRYDVKATYVGYKPLLIQNVVVSANQIRFLDIKMEPTAIALEEFEVREYAVPLIDKDQTSSGATVTAEEIAKMPNRSANAIAVSVGGVFSADGERGSVRGQRAEGTIMYIDGIRVRGSSSLPEAAIEQVSVILGGVPAQYGDAVGGIINVTTRGPSRTFGAGAEIETSQFLDAYGYNRASLNMQGPLLKSRKDKSSLLGYFVAGEFIFREDGRPTATGVYKAKDEILTSLETSPIRRIGQSSFYNSEFITKSDLEYLKATQNSNDLDVNISGKIDVRTTPNINLSFGGSYNLSDSRAFDFTSSIFNYKNNTQVKDNTWRVYGRLTHRFPTDAESKSFVKNVYYNLQADYSVYTYEQQDANHQDDLFRYGYIGSFTRNLVRSYEPGSDNVSGLTGWIHNAYLDTLYAFQRAEFNPILANYTQQYYDLRDGQIRRFEDLLPTQGGLYNGRGPDAVYNLWGNAGGLQTGYQYFESSQLGINAHFSAYLGNHEIRLGMQYEQRFDRSYNIGPAGLWTIMRGLTNFHIEQLDKSNPQAVYLNNIFMDTINYYRLFDGESQRTFDRNLRLALGLDPNGLDYLLIDSYDFNTNSLTYYDKDMIRRSVTLNNGLNINMFSADELFSQGNEIVAYYGFDHTGKKLSTKPSLDDFFNQTDENGDNLRHVGAFEPIYSAFYVQDKFAFKDLIFNVGLRIDRFDANQPVLKDPYLFAEAYTIAEDQKFNQHPGNMGSDYVIYVDQPKKPTAVTGYRYKDTWYTASGIEITEDPTVVIGKESGPYLKDPDKGLTPDSFEDYDPQLTFMPRISFSFPISDEALFFAHYNVLTQRPTTGSRIDLIDYFFIDTRGTAMVNNPNLKPEKTIDYELGFQQKLTNSSSLSVSGFYREIRDQIQSFRYTGAYPSTYYSYNNIDFGTVKGLTFTYDLRRTGNARIRASYTLQFANGTGSNPETARALIQSGQPNLRNLIPLDFDRRHAVNLTIDYRFDEGSKYNGPRTTRRIKGTDQVKTINWLQNAGFNLLIFGGSGTPYTKSSIIYQLGGSRQIQGSINGARLPWQFRIDARVDKDFNLKTSGREGKEREMYLNVYLRINNVLDSKNIMGVYAATGNPDDDGFLAAAEFQNQINTQLDPQSYRDLYAIRVNSPFNYSLPRMIRLGVSFNF